MDFIDSQKKIIRYNEPIITIDKYHFNFNAYLSKIATLDNYSRVRYSVNIENRAIKFKFHNNEKDEYSYFVSRVKNKKSFRSTSIKLVNDHLWIENVVLRTNSADRKFKAIRLGYKPEWYILLVPSFELKFKISEIDKIPSNLIGIYQYRDENNKIIYIGKGNVKKRLNETGRITDWDIHIIEASEIVKEKLQYEWENYWLNRFMEENNGKLPLFNKNRGKKSNKS